MIVKQSFGVFCGGFAMALTACQAEAPSTLRQMPALSQVSSYQGEIAPSTKRAISWANVLAKPK